VFRVVKGEVSQEGGKAITISGRLGVGVLRGTNRINPLKTAQKRKELTAVDKGSVKSLIYKFKKDQLKKGKNYEGSEEVLMVHK